MEAAAEKKHSCTSSKFHLITHRTEVDSAFIQRLFEDQDLSRVPAIANGQLWEETARLDYVERMKGTGHPDIQVRRCGLILHPAYEYLGASPDGQVFDPASTNGSHGLLEIKCPFAAYERDLTPEEACELPSFCAALGVNGRPELCEEHPYYYQVQGQL